MPNLRILYCDDEPEHIRRFAARHEDWFDVEPTTLGQADGRLRDGPLPDLLLLDLYHWGGQGGAQAEAEARLADLRREIRKVKDAVERAAAPAGIELLKVIRARYQPDELPVMMYTRRGLLLLDDRDMRTIAELGADWLVKDPDRIQDHTEKIWIEKFVAKRRRPLGDAVFIGHGRSTAWRELRDFLAHEVGLPWEEFNRLSAAGQLTRDRLEEMLDAAGVALIVFTAEDRLEDGRAAARQNVVHETGLCQGRLGFKRTAILLEDGCHRFSNIEHRRRDLHLVPER